MSNNSVKVAIALFMVLAPPAASFGRGGHGGSAAMGGLFPRPAGSAAMGNVPIT
jgi:Na+/glutamate symporter